jgi:hypothetical protein
MKANSVRSKLPSTQDNPHIFISLLNQPLQSPRNPSCTCSGPSSGVTIHSQKCPIYKHQTPRTNPPSPPPTPLSQQNSPTYTQREKRKQHPQSLKDYIQHKKQHTKDTRPFTNSYHTLSTINLHKRKLPAIIQYEDSHNKKLHTTDNRPFTNSYHTLSTINLHKRKLPTNLRYEDPHNKKQHTNNSRQHHNIHNSPQSDDTSSDDSVVT